MPKSRKLVKNQYGLTVEVKTSRKFRVGSRRDGRTAHTMSSQALSMITAPKYKANAESVLERRL